MTEGFIYTYNSISHNTKRVVIQLQTCINLVNLWQSRIFNQHILLKRTFSVFLPCVLSADTIVYEIVWVGQNGYGKSRSNRNSIPDHPARSESLSQPTLSQRITFRVTAVTCIKMSNGQSKKEHDPQPYITCSSRNQFPRIFAFPLATNTRPAICWSQICYT